MAIGVHNATTRGGRSAAGGGARGERRLDLEAWESPEVVDALLRLAARVATRCAAGEPTWEDAAWQ
jgi:hypothetical protein